MSDLRENKDKGYDVFGYFRRIWKSLTHTSVMWKAEILYRFVAFWTNKSRNEANTSKWLVTRRVCRKK